MKAMLALVVAPALCLGASACAHGSGATAGGGCSIRHATRVASDRYGSIVSTRTNAGDRVFRVCPRGGKAFALGHSRCLPPGAGHGLANVGLAGPYAGYSVTLCGIDTAESSVRVLDIRNRRTVLDSPAVSPPTGPETVMSVSALRLRADGAAAWVADAHSLATRAGKRELWGADSRHTARRLDSGAGIDPGSVRVDKGSVRWRNGTTAHRAALP